MIPTLSGQMVKLTSRVPESCRTAKRTGWPPSWRRLFLHLGLVAQNDLVLGAVPEDDAAHVADVDAGHLAEDFIGFQLLQNTENGAEPLGRLDEAGLSGHGLRGFRGLVGVRRCRSCLFPATACSLTTGDTSTTPRI